MKNIIFKSLVIGVLVMGVSIVANAQDTTKPVYKLKKVKEVEVKDLSHFRALKAESEVATNKSNRVIKKKVAVREAKLMRLEKAPEKRTVK